MRIIGSLLLLFVFSLAVYVSVQTPPPSLPLPTDLTRTPVPSTPTPTPAPFISVDLSSLQPITEANLDQLVTVTVLQCQTSNPFDTPDLFVRDIAWSSDPEVFAIVMYGYVCLYDLGIPDREPLVLPADSAWEAVFSPDGQTLAILQTGNQKVRLWDLNTGEEKSTNLEAGFSVAGNRTLAYSRDGKYIVTVSPRGGVRLYDAETEEVLVRAQIPNQSGVYLSGDGTRLVTVGREGISLWTLHPGPRLFRDQILVRDRIDVEGDVRTAIRGADGNLLYYFSGRSLIVYDLKQDQQVDSLPVENGIVFLPGDIPSPMLSAQDPLTWVSPAFSYVRGFAFNSDGTFLATIPDNSEAIVQLWGVPG
jgi:WD40 repeat protein